VLEKDETYEWAKTGPTVEEVREWKRRQSVVSGNPLSSAEIEDAI
jgi:hypothetical protein